MNMKKLLSILLSLSFLTSFIASAVPAFPYPVKVQQPDGSYISLKMHGDEFHHWATSDGVLVRQDENGFWRKDTALPSTKAPLSSGIRMTRENSSPKTNGEPFAKGKRKFLILLIDFTDLRMTYTKDDFWEMMNGSEYRKGGATGSVKEYFEDNSSGLFEPEFDIVGPVRLSKSYAYYGRNTPDGDNDATKAAEALRDACEIAYRDGLVNFNDYVFSGSELPMVFFFYAGYSEAEGAGANTIWPHAWSLTSAGIDCTLGLVKINKYACTSELQGTSGKMFAGIGPFCHEFSHVLGLHDLYDTDYEENGYANDMKDWSLMCNGSYLNYSHTPPYYLSIEREQLGWMDSIPVATEKGEVMLSPISEKSALMIPTTNKGETFVCEYRNGKKWDAYIPSGLIIYHRDASSFSVHGTAASQRWEDGRSLNAYSDHPCCYLLMNGAPDASVSSAEIPNEAVPFPGLTRTRTFSLPKDWMGGNTGYILSNIRETTSGTLSMTLDVPSGKKLIGSVYDINGKPVEAAKVSLRIIEQETKASSVIKRRQLATKNDSEYYTEVDSKGSFEFDLSEEKETEFELVVSCRGYISYSEGISLFSGILQKDIILYVINYSGFSSETLMKHKPKTLEGGAYVLSLREAPNEFYVATRYSASQLTGYEHCLVDSIFFVSPTKKCGKVYAYTQIGQKGLVEKEAKEYNAGGLTGVDVSSEGITIEQGVDYFFGYHVKDNEDTDLCYCTNDAVDGGLYYSTGSYWYPESGYAALIIVKLTKIDRTLDSAGINAIAVQDSYTVGSTYNFGLLSSASAVPTGVVWKYDGAVQTSGSVTLTFGDHLVEAVLTYKDGTVETLEQWIKVQ